MSKNMTYTYVSTKVTDDMDFIDVLRCTINGFKLDAYVLKMELSCEACRSEMTIIIHTASAFIWYIKRKIGRVSVISLELRNAS